MRYWLILIVLLQLSLPALAQQEYFVWERAKPLSWQHFQGIPDARDHVHAAVTYAGIALQVERVHPLSGEITFRARAVFDQQQSWVHPERQDPQILAHEQLHFDIAEVYARKLEQKLNALGLKKNNKHKARELQQAYNKAQLATQEQYDRESVHGLHESHQQAWRSLIDRELRRPGEHLKLQAISSDLAARP